MLSFTPEELILLGTLATVLGGIVSQYLGWRRTDRKADLKQPEIVANARVSTVTSFANELGINREMLAQLLNRDVQIGTLSGDLTATRAELDVIKIALAQLQDKSKAQEAVNKNLESSLAAATVRIKTLESDNKTLENKSLDSERRIKILETENRALEDKLVIYEQRMEDLETDNTDLRRQLEIERTRNNGPKAPDLIDVTLSAAALNASTVDKIS